MNERTQVEKDFEQLKRIRDELRLKLHLGKAEVKDTWERLEAQWPKVEEKLKALESESQKAGSEITKAAKAVLDEIRKGYEGLRG